MPNIAIMMNDGSTELPRPWNRASSQDELLEMVAYFIGYHTGKSEQQAADQVTPVGGAGAVSWCGVVNH